MNDFDHFRSFGYYSDVDQGLIAGDLGHHMSRSVLWVPKLRSFIPGLVYSKADFFRTLVCHPEELLVTDDV